MGWASGSDLCGKMVETIKRHVPDEIAREAIYMDVIAHFEDADCDTLYEVALDNTDPAFNKAYFNVHPDHRDE